MGYGPYQAGEEAERNKIAEYLDRHARAMEECSRAEDTPESIRTRQVEAALLRGAVSYIRGGAHLRGEESI